MYIPINFPLLLDDFSAQLMKSLMTKADFFYYSNHTFKMKQGLEILNLYFKDQPYYLYFTNLKNEENRKKLEEILQIFRESLKKNLIKDNFAFVVVDNEKSHKNTLFKLFKEKTFDLEKETLKGVKFEDKISHYEKAVLKKLKLKENELNLDSIIKLIKKEDINMSENCLFNKKVDPDNFKMINHVMYDFYIKPEEKNKRHTHIILIKNKDEVYNRDTMKRMRELAKMNLQNKNVKFYHMYNTEKNMEFLENKLSEEKENTTTSDPSKENYSKQTINPLSGVKSYPQVIIIKGNKAEIFPANVFLKYRTKIEKINNELTKLI